ncbi:MAG: hypothetical protein V3V45_04610 [Candidatus Brocadiales bacterium]
MQLIVTILFAIYIAFSAGVPAVRANVDTVTLNNTEADGKQPIKEFHHHGGASVKFVRGDDYITRWEIDKAGEVAGEILSAQPGSPEGLYLAAKVAFYHGQYKKAMELLEGPPQTVADGRWFLSFVTNIYETARNFEEYTTEHFIIRYISGKDEVLLEDAGQVLEQAYREIGKDLEYLHGGKVIVEVYPGVDSFSAASTLKRGEIETSGTVAICHFNRLMIMSPRLLLRGYPWADTLAHEYVHYVITKRTHNLTPIWFHEGLAKYEESRWKSDGGRELTPLQSHLLARALEDNYFITFEQMHPSIAKLESAEDAALAFAEVLTAMTYIIEKGGGYPALNDILDVIAAGRSVEEAVEEGLGVPFEVFERDWRLYLGQIDLKKIPGLKLMPLKIKKEGEKTGEERESPTEIEQTDARKFTMLGDLLEEQDRSDAALYEYEKARGHAGLGSPQILNKLARAYMQNHRDDDAQGVLDELLGYYPHYVMAYITQGELFAKHDDIDNAIKNFREALYINPFHPVVHQRLARLYNTKGDKELAKKHMQRFALVLEGPAGHHTNKKTTE